LLEEKKQIIDSAQFFKERKNARINAKFVKGKNRFFVLSVFLSMLIIGLIYFALDVSNIYTITVTGNINLKAEDIIEISGLSEDSKYILTIFKNTAKKVKSNPVIESCSINLLDGNVVNIHVVEKTLIGYTYEGLNYELVLDNDERITIENNNLYLINGLPFIYGFDTDKLISLEKQLCNLKYSLLDEISEIRYYPDLKYQYVEVIMRDGNYIFSSIEGLTLLNKYYDIKSGYGLNKNCCFYFEDISGNCYISSCPWNN